MYNRTVACQSHCIVADADYRAISCRNRRIIAGSYRDCLPVEEESAVTDSDFLPFLDLPFRFIPGTQIRIKDYFAFIIRCITGVASDFSYVFLRGSLL
jgi:hypothetical protein